MNDAHHLSILLYILCFEPIISNTKTSYLWRLNDDKSKIVEVKLMDHELMYPLTNMAPFNDPLFQILHLTEHDGNNWVKRANAPESCASCNESAAIKNMEAPLDCGKPVNFTYYDNLIGVLDRKKHPHIPDSQLIFLFDKKLFKNGQKDVDLEALEKKLRRAKKERPKSVNLYNQLGQLWYYKGNAEKAIECFRRALSVTPHNSEALLNLARILFSLQYLDDAIYLTRRSLELQNSDKIAWQQYFMLGQIFKAYGHYQEASVHLKHTLELKPGFEPAIVALMDIEYLPSSSIHLYTMVIIIFLASVVVLIMASTADGKGKDFDIKLMRPKSLSMRSLRFTLSQKRKKGCP